MVAGAWLKNKEMVVIPRVTNMRNGMYRPEVVWSKGRHSDIIIGESYDNKLRAELMAILVATGSRMSAPKLDAMWSEVWRAQNGIHDMLGILVNQIS